MGTRLDLHSAMNLATVRRLGLLPYSAALALQERLAAEYKDTQLEQANGVKLYNSILVIPLDPSYLVSSSQAGEVLVCQHHPVFTFGLRERAWQEAEQHLRETGAEVFKVNSLLSYHPPPPSSAPLALRVGWARWTGHLPWAWPVGVLPCSQPPSAQGAPAAVMATTLELCQA